MSVNEMRDREVYNEDLRWGYLRTQFNMSWFYECMEESGYEIEWVDEDDETSISRFERHINECVYKYIVSTIFCRDGVENKKIAEYESVWFYLQEQAITFADENPHIVKITHKED